MAESIDISGIDPAVWGDDWFLLDKSGSFALGTSVMATVYLVGGGCDGRQGRINRDDCMIYGGEGGDGGNVFKFNTKLGANVEYTAIIAEVGDKLGTSLEVNGTVYSSGRRGCVSHRGGTGGIISSYGIVRNPSDGDDGVVTPYGYIGSSGGGGLASTKIAQTGMSSGGIGAGGAQRHFHPEFPYGGDLNFNPPANAMNYGCGGGGGTFCEIEGRVGDVGKGMGGCIIIVWKETNDDADRTIRFYNTGKSHTTSTGAAAAVAHMSDEPDKINKRNVELKKKLVELEAEIAEFERNVNNT